LEFGSVISYLETWWRNSSCLCQKLRVDADYYYYEYEIE